MPLTPTNAQLHTDELISEDVRDIINYRPHWVVRRGNIIFFIILAGLFMFSCFISYPAKIPGAASIVATNTPKMIIAKGGSKIENILVKNQQPVISGQPIVWLQSTGQHEQVLKLHSWIDRNLELLLKGDFRILSTDPMPNLSNLGELQKIYGLLQTESLNMKQIETNGYYNLKKKALEKDLNYISTLRSNTVGQTELIKKDRQLKQKEFDAYEKLANEKVIAPLELNQYKSRLITNDQILEESSAQLTYNDVSRHNKQKELLELGKITKDLKQQFYNSLLSLKAEVSSWMQQFILVAPESGKLNFVNSLQKNQPVSTGEQLFYIQSQIQSSYAEVMVGQAGLGKVNKGQKVLLKPLSYPTAEFGHLSGTVIEIGEMPSSHDSFLIRVSLPQGLKTNYGKTLRFRNHLSASAEIITDDRKLISRIFSQLRQIWN